MTGFGVTSAVILAALLHASWNAAAHRIDDRLVGFALMGAAVALLPLAVLPFVATPAAGAWPYLLASATTHVVYMTLLLTSYRLGDFSQTYPLARGTSPLVVAIIAVTIVHQHLPPAHALGVVVVSIGLGVLVFSGGLAQTSRGAVVAAIATGLSIATYTVLDGVGVRAAHSTLGYICWLFILQGPVFPIVLVARRGRRTVADSRPVLAIGLLSGFVSIVAYGIVIWAQTRSNLASVSALRETSILFGALIGLVVFKERFGRQRIVGAALTVIGIVLLTS